MNEQKLHDHLRELEEELARLDSVDDTSRELLERLMEDIRATLAQSEQPTPEHHTSLRERISGAVAEFEDAHPTLTANLGRVLDAFGHFAH